MELYGEMVDDSDEVRYGSAVMGTGLVGAGSDVEFDFDKISVAVFDGPAGHDILHKIVLGYRSRCPGSIPGTSRFSEK
jgi:hypothetical protein